MSFQAVYLIFKYFWYIYTFEGNCTFQSMIPNTEKAEWAMSYSIPGTVRHYSSVPRFSTSSNKLHRFDSSTSHKTLGMQLKSLTLKLVVSCTFCAQMEECSPGRW